MYLIINIIQGSLYIFSTLNMMNYSTLHFKYQSIVLSVNRLMQYEENIYTVALFITYWSLH